MDLNTQANNLTKKKNQKPWVDRNHCVDGLVILYLTKVGNVLGILTTCILHKIEPQ